MRNVDLVDDYLFRGRSRLRVLEVLFADKNFADVVCESHKIVELTLKALVRASRIHFPRIHDVSDILAENADRVPVALRGDVERLVDISHELRRDRELAFYGTEDLTPLQFYKRKDADRAKAAATWVVETVSGALNQAQ